MNTDKDFFKVEVLVLVEDGTYTTCIRKIERKWLDGEDNPDAIIMREARSGAECAVRKSLEILKSRNGHNGYKRKEDIESYISDRFKKRFPEIHANILVMNNEILLYGITHNDWFIEGEGVNLKYPEVLDNNIGLTQYTSKYEYKGNGEWTYFRQGSIYYESLVETVKTPFKHEEVQAFVDEIVSEGYKFSISKIIVGSREDYEYACRRENEVDNNYD